MPIFFRSDLRILYIHIPKTGGTFIERIFRKNGFTMAYHDGGGKPGRLNQVRRSSPQHMEAEVLRALFDLSQFDYVFMTVREPIDRLISEFRMRRKSRNEEINRWIRKTLAMYDRNPYIYDNHVRPQVEFDVERASFFKQEDRYDQNWIDTINHQAGIELQLYPIQRAMIRDTVSEDTAMTVRETLSSDSWAALASFYREDFLRFDYPLP